MKYWIDVTSLPHVHFFRSLIKKLENDGNHVVVTSRDFGMMNDILDRNGIRHTSIGSHGGKGLQGKLVRSCERAIGLADFIAGERPDIAISKHSVECSRVSFGLSIPSVIVIDHDTASKQTRLTAPLSDVVVTPECTDKAKLALCGAKSVKTFRGVCETAHFRDFSPSEDVLGQLGLSKEETIIIARSEPVLASHNFHESLLFSALRRIKAELPDASIVLIPRHGENPERYRGLDAIVPETPVDTLSLYGFASLMIGGGSCMNREAAIGGCPTISVCPDRLPGVDRFLIEKGLIYHSTDEEDVAGKALEMLSSGKHRERNGKIANGFEDPYDAISKAVEAATAD